MLTFRNSFISLSFSLIMIGTLLVFIKASNNYLRIETIAGNGFNLFRGGEGFPAEKAWFKNPTGVCILPGTGELVFGAQGVTSSPLYGILKIKSDGNLTVLAGAIGRGFNGFVDGNRTIARIGTVFDLVCTSSGEIYFIDSTKFIRRIWTNGTVETIAGDEQSSVDDGPALSTNIQPWILAIHPITKEIYFAEPNRGRVRKISGGRIVTVAGKSGSTYDVDGLLATNTGFNLPLGIDFFPNGELLITDSNHLIRKIKLDGKVQTLYGNTVPFSTGYYAEKSVSGLSFKDPRYLKINSNGDIYFTENNHYIRKISGTKIYTVAGTGLTTANDYGSAINVNINSPLYKTFTSNGDLIFSENNHRILKESNGIITVLVGTVSYDGLNTKDINIMPSFVIKNKNEFYFDDSSGKFIGKIKEDGTVKILAGIGIDGTTDSGIAVESKITTVTGLTIYNNEIYFTESNSHKIKKITTSGYLEIVAGSTNGNVVGSVSIAKFNSPQNIHITQQGIMYIYDFGSSSIKKLNLSSGIVEYLNGNTYSGLQSFFVNANQEVIYSVGNYIRKIKTDNTNVILAGTGTGGYSDTGVATQSKIRPSYGITEYKGEIYFTTGHLELIAGTPTISGFEEGNPLLSRLNSPRGIFIDNNGTIYIADLNNFRIRVLVPSPSTATSPSPLPSPLISPSFSLSPLVSSPPSHTSINISPSFSPAPSYMSTGKYSSFATSILPKLYSVTAQRSNSPFIHSVSASSTLHSSQSVISSTLKSPSPDISPFLEKSLPMASSFLSSSSKAPSISSALTSAHHSLGISSTLFGSQSTKNSPSSTPSASFTQINNRSSPFFSLIKSLSFSSVNSFNSVKSNPSTLPSTLKRTSSPCSQLYFSKSTPLTSTSHQQISKCLMHQTSEKVLTSPSVAAISTQQYNSQRHSVIHSENTSKSISSNSKEYNFEINSFKVINLVGDNNSTLYFNETIFKPILNITSSFSISVLKFKIGYFNRFNSITWLMTDYTFIDNKNIYFKIPYFGSNNVTLIVSVLKEATELTTSKLEKEKTTIITLNRRENDLLNFVEKLLTSTNTTNEVENAIHYLNDNSDKLDLEKRKELRNNIIENISTIITTNNSSTKLVELLYLNTLKIDEINEKTTVSILNLTATHLDNKTDTKLATTLLSNLLETTLFNNITSSNNNSNTIITNKIVANTLFRSTLDKLTIIEENKLNVGEQFTIKENNLIKVIEKTKLNNLSFNLNNTLTSIIGTLSNFTLPIEELKNNIKKQGLSESDDISLSITKLPSKVYSFTSNETFSKSLNHVIRIQFIFKQQFLNITNLIKPIEFIVIGDVIGKCVYYNEKLNEFKEDGVSSTIIDSKTIKCSTNHLTDFTIIKTENTNKPIVQTSTTVVENRIDSSIVLNWRAIIGIVFGVVVFVLLVFVVILGICAVKLRLKKKNKKAAGENGIELRAVAKDSIV